MNIKTPNDSIIVKHDKLTGGRAQQQTDFLPFNRIIYVIVMVP
jgi:hypothetical protein